MKKEYDLSKIKGRKNPYKLPTECNNMADNETLLSTEKAAKFLGVSVVFLERDRERERSNIQYMRIGDLEIRYKKSDLLAYVDRRTEDPT